MPSCAWRTACASDASASSADARRRPVWPGQAPARQDDDPQSRACGPRLTSSSVTSTRRRAEPALGGGYHVHPDVGGLAVPGVGDGLLQPRGSSAGRSPTTCAPSSSSTRSRWPSPAAVPTPGLVHHSDQGSQYTSLIFTRRCRSVGDRRLDGKPRRLLRQRRARELPREPEEGPDPPALVADQGRGADRGLRLHRERSTTAGAAIRRSGCCRRWSSRTELSGPAVPVSPLRGSHPSTRWNTSQRQRPKPPNNPVSTEPGEVQIYFGDRFPG